MRSQSDVDDSVQDIMLEAWKLERKGRFDPARASADGYITLIAKGVIGRKYRESGTVKRGGGKTILSIDAARDAERSWGEPADSRSNLDRVIDLDEAAARLASLPKDHFALERIRLDRTAEQVSEILGVAKSTVDLRLKTARETLKRTDSESFLAAESVIPRANRKERNRDRPESGPPGD